MTRPARLLIAAVIGLASAPTGAQDPGRMMDSTGRLLFRFESIPSGAAIEFAGVVKSFTDAQFYVDPDYLGSIRLLLEGYLPCAFSDGKMGPARIGIAGVGTMFRCRLVIDGSIDGVRPADDWAEGPTTWTTDWGPTGPGPEE